MQEQNTVFVLLICVLLFLPKAATHAAWGAFLLLALFAGLLAIGNIFVLNQTMAEGEALFTVPVNMGAVLVCNWTSGLWVMRDFDP